MRCFTDDELRGGLLAVVAGGNRCSTCGAENEDEHDAQPHPFTLPDPLDLFLEAARRADTTRDVARGEHDPS